MFGYLVTSPLWGELYWLKHGGFLKKYTRVCVPEEVIKRVQEKLFSYLWRKRKNKRTVLYQRPRQGDLNFPNVRTTVKALRLSWIGRLLSESSEAWKAIPNDYRFS